jgi:tetratricopeptide (TPR) repeat protein
MTSSTEPRPTHGATRRPLSPVATRLLARARNEFQQQQLEAAERSLGNALALAPDDPDATRMLGMVVQRRGNHARAVDCFRRVLPVWPDDPDLRVGLGISLSEQGEGDEAIAQLRRACELAPGSAPAWFNLGEALTREALPAEAVAALQRALDLKPSHLSARLSLARAQANLGRVDAAVAAFRAVLRHDPGNAEGWFGLSNLNTVRFDAKDTACLQRLLAGADLPARTYELLGFAFAKALEDQGEYSRAFEAFGRANASRRKRVRWDAAGARERVDAILHAFNHELPASPDRRLGCEAILIVSIPRSGSTLVEQILASHPDVEGANEIKDLTQLIDAESQSRGAEFPRWVPDATAQDWQRLGREYLARTARWRETKPRFTDKNLVNWYLVGAALTMMPAARAIIVRRDPVETCLACYRQCFTERAGFACDLDDTADYCIDFLRLSRFWRNRFPGRVFDLRYETLVAEPEAAIRRLLEFCDLAFDPACLEPHKATRAVLSLPSAAQVREPLRRDTARSARYGDKLDHLRRRLRDAGALVE